MKAICLLIFSLVASCYSLPTGAPLPTCVDLTPQHGDAMTNPSPYEIDISDFTSSYGAMAGSLTYLPGAYYTITLRARNVSLPAANMTANMTGNVNMTMPATFRGFLIQARDMNDMPVGEFQDPSADQPLTRLSDCVPPTISVTHNNPGRVDMESVTFTWRAPTTVFTGPIRFDYTTVQVFANFWVAESTALIQETPLTCPGVMMGGASSVTSIGVWALLATAILTALKVTF